MSFFTDILAEAFVDIKREPRNLDHPFLHKTEDKFNSTTTFTYWPGFSDEIPISLRSSNFAYNRQKGWVHSITDKGGGTFFLRMRCVIVNDKSSFVLDYAYFAADWLFLKNGNIIVNIESDNNKKSVNLKLFPSSSNSEVKNEGGISEWGHYEITKDEIKQIADGSKIELRISADNIYFDVANKISSEINKNGDRGDGQSFKLMMMSFYNNMIDKNAYSDDLSPFIEEIKNFSKKKSNENNKKDFVNTNNTKVKKAKEWYNSNTLLIVLLIIFWPAAIFIYVYRMLKKNNVL